MASAARILVVDDEAHARNALLELLRDEGYDVDSARDGADAAARLPQFRPDVVLTDVEMPRMDGLALAAAARTAPDAPVVVLMSSRQPTGEEPFVAKPIILRELLATLERALKRRRR